MGIFSDGIPSERGAGPERDMLSLRDGMVSGWDRKFFRRRRRRRRRRRPPKMCVFGGNGLLRDRVETERSQHDTTAILIVRTLRIFLDLPKNGVVLLVRVSPH